jgi:hypothetical protein
MSVEEPDVLGLGPVDRERFTRLDADAVYCHTFLPVDVGLAASGSCEPATPLQGRSDHDGRLAIEGHLWCVNLQAADHQSNL